MLCDERGFSYAWHLCQAPYLVKGHFKVACSPSHNVPVVFSNLLQDDEPVCEAPAGRDVQPLTETETDPETPGLANSSFGDEGDGRQPKINRKIKRRLLLVLLLLLLLLLFFLLLLLGLLLLLLL